MTATLDPCGAEPQALSAAVDFSAQRILEIGAGSGRLTFRFGGVPRFVVAIELDLGEVATANRACPGLPDRRPVFLPGTAMKLPFRRRTFDVAVLAWSL